MSLLLRRRLPPRHRHSRREPHRERLGHPVDRLRVHDRRRLELDDDRHRYDGPGAVHGRLGHDARRRRPLRPAHSGHGQRGQHHDGDPPGQGGRQHGARRCARRRADRGLARDGHRCHHRFGLRCHLPGRVRPVLRPGLAVRYRHVGALLARLEHDERRRRGRDDPGRCCRHGRQHDELHHPRRLRRQRLAHADAGRSGSVPQRHRLPLRQLRSGYDPGRLRATPGGRWSTIATTTSAPFGATWDATTVSTGSYDLRPVITDRVGNTFTGATVTVDVDVTAPTVVLTNPGATISGIVTLNATVSGTGATQVVFGATPAGGAAWTSINTDTSSPWSATFETTTLTDGLYDLRATVSDSLGNSSVDVVTGIRIDNTAPRVISSTPTEGSTVTSASSISLVASEAATPVGVTLDGSATVAPVISGTTITYGTGALSTGPHTLAGELQDSAGKKTPFRVHFTVWSSSGSVAPYVEKNTGTSSSTTVESADGFAAATMPSGAWSTSGTDWIVIRIAPMAAPSGLTNGFAPGPEALDVTAWWALAATPVHQLSQPVGILMRSTEKGLVPATFEDGSWRILGRVPVAGTLPAGWDDGFYSDASGFHVMTRHLSVFALLRDLEPPQPPQNVRGFLGPGGLTLRWLPGADNSGTYGFVTVFSGSTDIGHYGVDYTAAGIGSWSTGDPRVFRLKETDLAGNESALTPPLRPVPPLVGLTADQAEEALTARGFTLGTLTIDGTGRPGTVTGPVGLVLAEEGAAIDLTVAPGRGGLTRFVFKVQTAPKFKPSARKTIAARVSVTRAARVNVELFSPRRLKLFTWRFSVKAGRTIVKLRIPRQVR